MSTTQMLTALGGFYGLMLIGFMFVGGFFAGLAIANMARNKYTKYTKPGAYSLPAVKSHGAIKGAGKGGLSNTVFFKAK